ncbi:MAG: hypothetical protein ATN36_00635 [Epulopiscium sp. Nele67-Bin005]|nr:MAG: hypothetical protein ATN36_00635 [Epulopiscium sp. Nele67-Bin005]
MKIRPYFLATILIAQPIFAGNTNPIITGECLSLPLSIENNQKTLTLDLNNKSQFRLSDVEIIELINNHVATIWRGYSDSNYSRSIIIADHEYYLLNTNINTHDKFMAHFGKYTSQQTVENILKSLLVSVSWGGHEYIVESDGYYYIGGQIAPYSLEKDHANLTIQSVTPKENLSLEVEVIVPYKEDSPLNSLNGDTFQIETFILIYENDRWVVDDSYYLNLIRPR